MGFHCTIVQCQAVSVSALSMTGYCRMFFVEGQWFGPIWREAGSILSGDGESGPNNSWFSIVVEINSYALVDRSI